LDAAIEALLPSPLGLAIVHQLGLGLGTVFRFVRQHSAMYTKQRLVGTVKSPARAGAQAQSKSRLSGFNKFTQAEAEMFRKFTRLMFS
jgi:hypothetical protein